MTAKSAPIKIEFAEVKNILTRTSGYLEGIATHSLQPYRGCTFGNSLCGVACYVQHNPFVTKGRKWGRFLEVRTNAAESYLKTGDREREYAKKNGRPFGIFLASSTDPFLPQEARHRITQSLFKAMLKKPPECLIVQTHSQSVKGSVEILTELQKLCQLRVHISIETDLERIPGLPPPANSVASRIQAAGILKRAGIKTVITVAPLLPIKEPKIFFPKLRKVSDALVLDHYVGGDGTADGRRTKKTPLPEAMENVTEGSSSIEYLQKVLEYAQSYYEGPIGVGRDGFAGRYLISPTT